MCGIVGYIGKDNSVPILIEGLLRLEYRGYDSAGIAYFDNDKICQIKRTGRVSVLKEATDGLNGGAGIGHTRWATHGKATEQNAHPHTYGKFTIVHNGIIENFAALKSTFGDEQFLSETDTEVVAHILAREYDGDFLTTVKRTVEQLRGGYALVILCSDFPDQIVAARRDNPILVGVGDGEAFIASDVLAISDKATTVFQVENGGFAVIKANETKFFDANLGIIKPKPVTARKEQISLSPGRHKSFMLKEICEIPTTLRDTIANFYKNPKLKEITEKLKNTRNITIVGCGTAYHSGIVGKYLLERLARIHVETELASEYRYKNPIINKGDVLIAVSQSGETADTIAAVNLAKARGAFIIVITNVVNSAITEYADIILPTLAGAEIGVAATKSYVGQICVFMALAIEAADRSAFDYLAARQELEKLPDTAQTVIDASAIIKPLARKLAQASSVFFIGRNLDYAVAMEGSLKLKEISYVHSEGYAAGELKHGTIALIDDSAVVVAIATQREIAEKTLNAVHEVRARGAKIVLVTSLPEYYNSKDADYIFPLPEINELFAPSISVIPMQVFALYSAQFKGYDPDKPRNLAKSVTVE